MHSQRRHHFTISRYRSNRTRGERSRRGRFFAVALVVAAAVAAGCLGTAKPAQASAGNVWVIFSSPADCPYGGSVTGIYAAIDGVWSTGPGGDWGDNIIYPHVLFYQWNTLNARVFCNRPWYRGGGYWNYSIYHQFYPVGWNQNFWF